MNEPQDGSLVVVSGKSRSGKTAYVMRRIKTEKRVIAWDVEDQFSRLPGWRRVTSQAELLRLCQQPGPAKIAYVAGGELKTAFNFWAGCVMHWGRYFGGCVAIAEELSDVTSQSKAPGLWGTLIRRGLKRNVTIFAISQRWAEADKTAMGNASEYIIFCASTGSDMDYLAKKTGIDRERIGNLKPLEYIRKDVNTGKIEGSKLVFRK